MVHVWKDYRVLTSWEHARMQAKNRGG